MKRYDLLQQISERIERLFDDDLVFELFLDIEQCYENGDLVKILAFDDIRFYKFIEDETCMYG